MRILVAIDRGPVSEEVAAAVAHLTTATDDIHLLTVVHPREVGETVPRTGGLASRCGAPPWAARRAGAWRSSPRPAG